MRPMERRISASDAPMKCDRGDSSQPMKTEMTITGQGRVISKHASGVICAYDSQHRILKVALEGGVISELVQERTDSDTIYGEYRNQLLMLKNGRDVSLIEFSKPPRGRSAAKTALE